mgnify:CR=1 FL=1
MEEALDILWTYARREPLDSNGETVVPTINNSIAAIRIIMRLEGWAMGSEKRKMNSEKRATSDKPAHGCMGKVSKNEVGKPSTQYNTNNNDDEDNYDKDNDNEDELPFAPTQPTLITKTKVCSKNYFSL